LSVGDAPAVYTLDPWAELRLAAILPGPRHGVLSPAEVLEMATLGGARALGLEAELGSIEPGKKADLLVVRVPDGARDVLEALVLGTRATDVGHVIVDGLVRLRQGRFVGVRDRRSLA
jgi:cytosine/adenosine deaminase-related metal-dependent hydrolase